MSDLCRRGVFVCQAWREWNLIGDRLYLESVVKFSQSFKHFIIKRPQGNRFFFPIPRHKKCSLNKSVKITLSMNFGPAAYLRVNPHRIRRLKSAAIFGGWGKLLLACCRKSKARRKLCLAYLHNTYRYIRSGQVFAHKSLWDRWVWHGVKMSASHSYIQSKSHIFLFWLIFLLGFFGHFVHMLW